MKSGTIDLYLSEVQSLQAGDVTDDMCPIPVVYQRILNSSITILH